MSSQPPKTERLKGEPPFRLALQRALHPVWKKSWPILLMACLVAIFFWQFPLLGEVFVPADTLGKRFPWRAYNPPDFRAYNHYTTDIIDSQYPARAVAVDTLRSGQLPLWDPYTSSGKPLATMPIYPFSFPLNFLLLLFPLDVGFTWQALARVFIAGVGMYAFLRQFRLRKLSALAGGVIFAFNGFIVVWLNATAGVTLSMAPLVLWATERLLRRPRVRDAAILALTVATLVSGGFLQVALYVLYTLVAYVVFKVGWEAWHSRAWRPALWKLGLVAAAVLAGFALMAPQLFSFYGRLDMTTYDESRTFQATHSTSLYSAIRYLIPDYYGHPVTGNVYGVYPERTGYVGILPLLLSFVAIAFTGQREKSVWFFAVLAGIAIGLIYGAPINRLVALLPGLGLSSPTRVKAVLALYVAILAAFGLDELQQRRALRDAWWKLLIVLLLFAALQATIVLLTERYWTTNAIDPSTFDRTFSSIWKNTEPFGGIVSRLRAMGRQDPQRYRNLMCFLLWTAGSLTLPIAWVKGWITSRSLRISALCLICLDLLGWGIRYNHPVDRDQVFLSTPGIEFLRDAPGLFRMTGLDNVLFPNTSSVYGLQDIAGHDPLASDRYRTYLGRIDPDTRFGVRGTVMRLARDTADLSSPLLDLLNVHYVAVSPNMTPGALTERDETFVQVYQGRDMGIYQNSEALPRCYLVSQVEVVPDPQAILDRLASGQPDPTQTALLEEEIEEPFWTPSAEAPRTDPQILVYSPNRVEIQVDTAQPALLVLGDPYHPNWEARLDGQPVAIYRANYLFRGVVLPAGTHRVEFVFRPWPYIAGQILRLSTMLALTVAATRNRLTRNIDRAVVPTKEVAP